MSNPVVTEETLMDMLRPIAELVARKNRDYGASVFKRGLVGIAVRLEDKIERLANLILNKLDAAVADEGVRDTFKDVIGYASLAILLMDHIEDEETKAAAVATVTFHATLEPMGPGAAKEFGILQPLPDGAGKALSRVLNQNTPPADNPPLHDQTVDVMTPKEEIMSPWAREKQQ